MPSRPPTRSHASAAPSRPTTAVTTATSVNDEGSWLLALLPSRGTARDVGVVAMERELGHVVVTQYTDSSTFVKTVHLCKSKPPSVILVPQTALEKARTGGRGLAALAEEDEEQEGATSGEAGLLVKSLRETFPGTPLMGVARKPVRFEFLTQLIITSDDRVAVLSACKSKYYALSAACALFKYLEREHGVVFPPKSLLIRYAPLEGTCLIDTESARNLELVANLLNKNSKQHLLGILHKCFTPMGTRLLRTNILSPLTDPIVIDTRLDTVEELVNSEERFRAVRKALEPLKSLDLDKIVSRVLSSTSSTKGFSTSTGARGFSRGSLFPSSSSSDPSARISQKLSHLLSLRLFLSTIPALRSAVERADSKLLRQIESILADDRLDEIKEEVGRNVNKDIWGSADGGEGKKGRAAGASFSRQAKLFAIKAERKRLLDVARETYRENLSDQQELLEQLQQKHGLETLQLVQTASSGFVLQCGADEWAERAEAEGKGWDRGFINVNKKGKKVEMSTLDLKKRNARLLESEQEILLMSDEILDEMFGEIRGNIAALYRCAEALAMLDMLAAFADVAGKNEYVRPEWTDTLAIKAGRHPLHEQFRMADGSFVPNDIYASDAASFQLVFGPNMSGKSTLLRQTALLHVMAQIGCYVPASYASFRPIHCLLTRLSNDDNLESSLSTFASEISTMSMVLTALAAHAERPCLVLVDELGRGTSPEEGVGIAHAVAEEIVKSKAFCFFATHFKELSTTLDRYPNVVSLQLETEVDPSQPDYSMTFHHRLVDGTTAVQHYGLELAKIAKLPAPVLDKAQLVSLTLESLAQDGRERSAANKVARRRKELLKLKTVLRDLLTASSSRLTDPAILRETLREIQDETVQMLAETMGAGPPPASPSCSIEPSEDEDGLSGRLEEVTMGGSGSQDSAEDRAEEGMLDFD
ncbi:MutS protein msh4 [Rhodosporidiobolus nylandii]